MAGKGVSALKFVGTVSLGLLTGLSYTLTTLTVPALLNLPSAETASRAFDSLTYTAQRHLRSLTGISGVSFLMAYYLSPRPARHPYLLYTSMLIYASQFAVSEYFAPYLHLLSPGPVIPSAEAKRKRDEQKKQKAAAARARMEASYEVLSADAQSAASEASGAEDDEQFSSPTEAGNGEEVRVKVEAFIKKQVVQGSIVGLAFFMSIVGIWGDGVLPV